MSWRGKRRCFWFCCWFGCVAFRGRCVFASTLLFFNRIRIFCVLFRNFYDRFRWPWYLVFRLRLRTRLRCLRHLPPILLLPLRPLRLLRFLFVSTLVLLVFWVCWCVCVLGFCSSGWCVRACRRRRGRQIPWGFSFRLRTFSWTIRWGLRFLRFLWWVVESWLQVCFFNFQVCVVVPWVACHRFPCLWRWWIPVRRWVFSFLLDWDRFAVVVWCSSGFLALDRTVLCSWAVLLLFVAFMIPALFVLSLSALIRWLNALFSGCFAVLWGRICFIIFFGLVLAF